MAEQEQTELQVLKARVDALQAEVAISRIIIRAYVGATVRLEREKDDPIHASIENFIGLLKGDLLGSLPKDSVKDAIVKGLEEFLQFMRQVVWDRIRDRRAQE